jgi:polyferredoxin
MVLEIVGEILKLTVLSGLTLAGILAIYMWKKDLTSKVSYLRILVQTVSFVGFFYLFTYPVWQLLVLGVILIMTIVLGRFYCGWLCPFAFYMDLFTLVRKASKTRHRSLPDRLNKALHNFRYVLLLFFLIVPFVLVLIEPPPSFDFGVVMALLFAGPFAPYRILLGPTITLIVPWQGPLVINEIGFSYPYIQEIIYYLGGILGAILALIFIGLTVAGSFLVRRVWCRFCPTGSSLAVVNRLRGFRWAPVVHLDKDEEKCTKCGICKRVCPVQVTEVYEQKGGKITTSMCMLCTRCVEMCPYKDCLKVKVGRKTVFKSRNWLEHPRVREESD